MYTSGARGRGNEILHYPVGYAGFPNAFTAPDTRRQVIIGKLAAIDVLSDSPRTRRECMLGMTSYMQSLDDQAAALRAELAAL